MRGTNHWHGSGNVGHPIKFSRTMEGVECCSFMVAVDSKSETTWIRINVYWPNLVDACRKKLSTGAYVIVDGELMNRRGNERGDKFTEVRATDLIVLNQRKREDQHANDVDEHGKHPKWHWSDRTDRWDES